MLEANKKLLLGPVVKYFRKKCCGEEGHCTNLLEGGYRKNMLMNIGNVVEAMKALCIEQRIQGGEPQRHDWTVKPDGGGRGGEAGGKFPCTPLRRGICGTGRGSHLYGGEQEGSL